MGSGYSMLALAIITVRFFALPFRRRPTRTTRRMYFSRSHPGADLLVQPVGNYVMLSSPTRTTRRMYFSRADLLVQPVGNYGMLSALPKSRAPRSVSMACNWVSSHETRALS